MLAVFCTFTDGHVVPAADLETDLHDNRQRISDEVGVMQVQKKRTRLSTFSKHGQYIP